MTRRGALRRIYSCPTVPFETLLSLFLPLLLESVCTHGFALLNSSMVSSSGMSVLSAVSLVESVNTLVVTVFQGIASGASILVAQYLGARKDQEMRSVASLSVSFTAALSLAVSAGLLLAREPLLRLCFASAEEDVIAISSHYLLGDCLSLPLCAVWAAELGTLRGAGESRIAMVSVIANSVVYLALNYLFLIVLRLSVDGLILSLAVSRILALVSCAAAKRAMGSVLRRRLRDLLRPDFARLRRILVYGFPLSFENLLMKSARLVLLAIVTPLGTNAIASYNIAYNITVFSQIPSSAILGTTFVAAGMCMGAERPEELRALYGKLAWANRALFLLLNGAILLLRRPVLAAFHPEPEMIPVLTSCIILVLTCEVLFHTESFNIVYLLRGCGDIAVTTLAASASLLVFRVGAAWFFARHLQMGVFGVFLGLCSDWAFRAVFFGVRFLRGRWMKRKVLPG